MKRASVAVVIPFYNGSKYIQRAIDSVLTQTVQADEFVIVNDGSRPEERDFLHRFASDHPITVIDQDNAGQGAARNTGVRATRSEFICCLDQDDFYLRNHIKALTSVLPIDDPEFGWVYADAWAGDGEGNILQTSIVAKSSDHPKTDINNLIKRDMFVLPSMSLISRRAFEAVGGFDPQFRGYEDDDLFMRIFRKGFTNYFTPEAVTVWCLRPDSTSGTIHMSRSRIRYFKKLAATFPDDRAASRFYVRDFLIPRFHPTIIGEVIGSLNPDNRLYAHRTEVLSLFRDYVDTILPVKSVSPSFRRRLQMHLRVLSSNSMVLIRASHLAVAGLKHLNLVVRH
jgi:glycosyltransferase involved in cell wall biosynthesis